MQDILCHSFSFLDYSHTTTLSLVCKEWNQIANSNSLWEFYFHLLTNNKKGKTKVSSSVVSGDDLFWKHKMRDNFSKYSFRVSKKLSSTPLLNIDTLKGKFPDHFSSQVVKMILSRILLESLEFIENFDLPHMSCKILPSISDDGHFKLKFRISGIDETLIARWFDTRLQFFLNGNDYVDNFYIYISKESDDKVNEQYMKGNQIDLNSIAKLEKAYIFKFNGQNNPANVWGIQYLIDSILSHIVPTVEQYDISPTKFVPYWCFLFSLIICVISREYEVRLKEVTKHYPNIISNRLFHHYFAQVYRATLYKLTNEARGFDKYEPKTNIQQNLFNRILKNKTIPPLNTKKKLEAKEMLETIQALERCISHDSTKFISGPKPYGMSVEDEFALTATTISKLYKLTKNPIDLQEAYLDYKFKRPFQL